METNYTLAAHLLRRAGFGDDPDAVNKASQLGLSRVTDAMLNPDRTPDGIDDAAMIAQLAKLVPENKNGFLPVLVVKMWWTYRMLMSPNPLVEKMTLFWHGHFTSKITNIGELMLQQNQLYRDNALGNFRTLALAVSRNPAMLVYLNGNQNYKEHPNENYARELMEIFTCGIGNYTEDDVKASARAFSGWNLQRGKFVFNPRQHDDGLKTFMGRTGNLNGDDIVDILVAHPSTATRLCEQLFTYFAYPDPKPEIIAALTQTYYKSGYDIKAVVGQILRSQAFYEAKAQNAIIKCPVQFVIGTAKMLGLTEYFKLKPEDITPQNDDARAFRSTSLTRPNGNKTGGLAALVIAMRNMGQDILAPPNVKGWDGGEDWINSTTLLARSSFANAIAQNAMVTAMLNDDILTSELSSASDLIDQFAIRMGPLPLSSATRAALVDYYLNSYKEFTGDSRIQFGRKSRVRQVNRVKGLLALIMATPEYQVC